MDKVAKRDMLDIESILPEYASLPDGAAPLREKLWGACVLFVGFGKGFAACQPILGKVILRVKETEAWREWGYHSFSDFVQNGMPTDFSVPPSQAWACYRLVEHWPTLEVRDCIEIGSVKLRELSRVTSEAEPNGKKWLEKAKALPSSEFKDEVSSHLGTTPEQDKLVRIELVVSKEIREAWEEFLKEVAYPALETESMGAVLEALMAEARTTWQRN